MQQAPTPSRPISEVALWTGFPQSYMDLCVSRPYLREDNTISRADVWHLRHDCWEVESEGLPFRNTPLLGWPPFGVMCPDELELEVRDIVAAEDTGGSMINGRGNSKMDDTFTTKAVRHSIKNVFLNADYRIRIFILIAT